MIVETKGYKGFLEAMDKAHKGKDTLLRNPGSFINIFLKPTNSIHKMTILGTYCKDSQRGKVFSA
jgi:hypothetical protein